MSLLKAYLSKPSTKHILNRKPGEKGFSLIELVVVIAVLAVLTAIALPNFLGVSEDASVRTAQQGALNAFKECKVFWARNKRNGAGVGQKEFQVPSITDWLIVGADATTGTPTDFSAVTTYAEALNGGAQPAATSAGVACFTAAEASRSVWAIPTDRAKYPSFAILPDGTKTCIAGTDNTKETYNTGCASNASNASAEWK